MSSRMKALRDEWQRHRKNLLYLASQSDDSDDGSNEGPTRDCEESEVIEEKNKEKKQFDHGSELLMQASQKEDERLGDYQKLLAANSETRIPGHFFDRYALISERTGPKLLNPHEILRNVMIFIEDDAQAESTRATFKEIGFRLDDVAELQQAVLVYKRKRHLFDAVAIGLKGPTFKTLRFLEMVAPIKVPVVIVLPGHFRNVVVSAGANLTHRMQQDEPLETEFKLNDNEEQQDNGDTQEAPVAAVTATTSDNDSPTPDCSDGGNATGPAIAADPVPAADSLPAADSMPVAIATGDADDVAETTAASDAGAGAGANAGKRENNSASAEKKMSSIQESAHSNAEYAGASNCENHDSLDWNNLEETEDSDKEECDEESQRRKRELKSRKADKEMLGAIKLALKLGGSFFSYSPLTPQPLLNRLNTLMMRFGTAAKLYKQMVDLADSDFQVKQAKSIVIEQISSKDERRKTLSIVPNSNYVSRQSQLAHKDTVDTISNESSHRRMSKVATTALDRNRVIQQAKQRVKQASTRMRLEKNITAATLRKAWSRRSSKRGSISAHTGLQRKGSKDKVASKDDRFASIRKLLKKNTVGGCMASLPTTAASEDSKLVMNVIADLAKKQNVNRGMLPLLKDSKGMLSYIQLPWDEDSNVTGKRVMDGMGSSNSKEKNKAIGNTKKHNCTNITKPKPGVAQERDILSADFREQVPTTKCATAWQNLLQKGYELKKKSDLIGAKWLYTRAIMANQHYAAAFLCRGVVHHLLGEDMAALHDFAECVRIDPRNVHARFNRALIFAGDSQDNDAARELDKAVEIDSKDPELYGIRSFIYRRRGDFKRAQEDCCTRLKLQQSIQAKAEEERKVRELRRRRFKCRAASEELKLEDEDQRLERVLCKQMAALENRLRTTKPQSTIEHYKRQDESDNNMVKKKYDTNFDGRIDLAEFTAATQQFDSVYGELFQRKSDLELACSKPVHLRTVAELDMIMKAAREIKLFRSMPQRYIRELCREVKLVNVTPGDYIIQQGSEAFNFFAILDGEVDIMVKFSDFDQEHMVNKMKAGETFGENGLIRQNTRAVSVIASPKGETVQVFVVSRSLFIRTNMNEWVSKERMNWIKVLREAHIFDDMDELAFQDFSAIVRPVEYKHNTVVLRQGEPASRFCILVKGICKTLKFTDYYAELMKEKHELTKQLEQFEMAYSVHHNNFQAVSTTATAVAADTEPVAALAAAPAGASGKKLAPLSLAPTTAVTEGLSQDANIKNKRRKKELLELEKKLAALAQDPNYVDKKGKLIHTSTIYPGNILGEEALLDPYYGKEQYTVVTDTYCTFLIVHKDQLHTYKQSEMLFDKVRRKKIITTSNCNEL